MSENIANRPFKEAVCIDAMRVFDSCSSQDCLEDLELTFAVEDEEVINDASYIKVRSIAIPTVGFVIDPVPFNKGFYTVEVNYTFNVEVEAFTTDGTAPQTVYGTAQFAKKVILYGSDGSTLRFVSGETPAAQQASAVSGCACCSCDVCTLPTAVVSVAPPMCLDAALSAADEAGDRIVTVTIGIFAIIQLSRPVPLMIPAYDYCMPGKECASDTDSPCELFDKIAFPASEFFPQALDTSGSCGCGDDDSGNSNSTQSSQTQQRK